MARDGAQYCWNGQVGEIWDKVVGFLASLESQTWGELSGHGKNPRAKQIPVDELPPEAQRRLLAYVGAKNIPDSVWELHLGGEPRIWGARKGAVFEPIFWDPHHGFFPSHKRHT